MNALHPIEMNINDILDQFAETVATRVATRLLQCRHEPDPKASTPDFMSEIEVSRRTGLSRRTLQGWRAQGRGPKYVRTGRRVLYPAVELWEFLRARSTLNGSRHREISNA